MEFVRKEKGKSKNWLEEKRIMRRAQYNTLLKAKKGPRIDVLERLLTGMGASWYDWADACDAAKGRDGASLAAELTPRYRTMRPKKNPKWVANEH